MAPQPEQPLSEPLLVSVTSSDAVPLTVGEDTRPADADESTLCAAGDDVPILPSVNSYNGQTNGKPSLMRSLTVVDGVSMVLGVVVGSGLFATPAVVLSEAGGNAIMALIFWLLAGAVAFASAEVYGELGSAIPNAGGDGEYLQVAFGGAASFVFTWVFFFVSTGGSMAILIVTFLQYAMAVVPGAAAAVSSPEEKQWWLLALGILTVVLLTLINCVGLRLASSFQNLLTVAKSLLISSLLLSSLLFFLFIDPSVAAANFSLSSLPSAAAALDWGRAGAGLIAAIWAFDGWNCLGFLAEELHNPRRSLPRALSYGMTAAIVIMVSVNAAFFCVLPAPAVLQSDVVAVTAIEAAVLSLCGPAWGPAASWLAGRTAALLVALNVLGCANATLLCNSRYFFSRARDGQIPKFLSAVASNGAPYASLTLISVWTILLLFVSGSQLGQLVDYFGIATWVMYGAVAAALIKLRIDVPHLPRPFSTRLYPLPPVLVILAAIFLVASSTYAHPLPSASSLAFVLVTWLLYHSRRLFC